MLTNRSSTVKYVPALDSRRHGQITTCDVLVTVEESSHTHMAWNHHGQHADVPQSCCDTGGLRYVRLTSRMQPLSKSQKANALHLILLALSMLRWSKESRRLFGLAMVSQFESLEDCKTILMMSLLFVCKVPVKWIKKQQCTCILPIIVSNFVLYLLQLFA